MAFTALYDACVLYPAPLRDLLLQLALTDRFRAKWSNAIHEEWICSVLKERPDLRISESVHLPTLISANGNACRGYLELLHIANPATLKPGTTKRAPPTWGRCQGSRCG